MQNQNCSKSRRNKRGHPKWHSVMFCNQRALEYFAMPLTPNKAVPIMRNWKQMKFRQRAFIFSLLINPVIFVALGMIIDRIPSGLFNLVASIAAFSCLGCTAASGFLWTVCPCPNCGRMYFTNGVATNQLSRRCIHCGQKKWGETQEKTGVD